MATAIWWITHLLALVGVIALGLLAYVLRILREADKNREPWL